jgi:transposase
LKKEGYMIKIRLNEEQKKALKTLRNTRSTLGERAHYILLSNEGQDVKKIAQKLNRHEHTIRSWIKSYAKNGIHGLNSKQPSGRPKIKGCIVEEEVEVMLTKTPRDFGYQEEGWTVRIMLDFFQKKFQVKEDTIRRAIKRKGWVYKRFAKSVPKNAPSKEEKQKKIEQLIEKLKSDQPDETFFVDEANFMTGPYVQRGWFKRRDKKKSPAQ